MKKGKNKKFLTYGIIFVLIFNMSLLVATAEEPEIQNTSIQQNTVLQLSYYGYMRLLFTPAVGVGIENIGIEDAVNVTVDFSVHGGLLGMIDFSDTYVIDKIDQGTITILSWAYLLHGFGPITLEVEVSALNADSVSKSAMGIQISDFTFIIG